MPHLLNHSIQRQALVGAPRPRVWQALTQASHFCSWFKASTPHEFGPGATLLFHSAHLGYEYIAFQVTIDEMQAPTLLVWTWHPGGDAAATNAEQKTRVTWLLEEQAGGTLVTVSETGFDLLPEDRRAQAWQDNSQGWEMQLQALAAYLTPQFA